MSIQDGKAVFSKRWEEELKDHLKHDRFHDRNVKDRARDSRRQAQNVLYVDQLVPRQNFGGGFSRAYDNLVAMSSLDYHVTVTGVREGLDGPLLSDVDKEKLEQNGLELLLPIDVDIPNPNCKSVRELLESRPQFYSVIIISRPPVFEECKQIIMGHCHDLHCSIIYDAEALWFRRDEMFLEVAKSGLVSHWSREHAKSVATSIAAQRERELSKLRLVDVIITVSDSEKEYIDHLSPPVGNSVVVGHIMSSSSQTETPYEEREGILFVGGFHNSMYYNGDSLWWFLDKVYPIVAKESAFPIPITIAGKGIPQEVRTTIRRKIMIMSRTILLHLVSILSSCSPSYHSFAILCLILVKDWETL